MELETVNWSIGRPSERSAPATATPAAPGAKPETRGEYAVFVELSGRVNATQRNDYRGITAQVESFASALSAAGYQLIDRKLPFDITSEGTLTGDIAAGSDTGDAPRFTIVISRHLP